MAHATFARILAPLAIAACAVALVLVVTNTLKDEAASSSGSPSSVTTTSGAAPKAKAKRRHRHRARTYTVKSGDILSTVAERTGVSVERLQELNPDVDPNALQVGQKLKLRP
jgi:LysM repeat protein